MRKFLVLLSIVGLMTFPSFAKDKGKKGERRRNKGDYVAMFNKRDINKDSKLDQKEFIGKAKKEKRIERRTSRFVKIDTNKDSFVTLEEVKAKREKRKNRKNK
jgi:hypothetical protein